MKTLHNDHPTTLFFDNDTLIFHPSNRYARTITTGPLPYAFHGCRSKLLCGKLIRNGIGASTPILHEYKSIVFYFTIAVKKKV
jgi:hypothetical protein